MEFLHLFRLGFLFLTNKIYVNFFPFHWSLLSSDSSFNTHFHEIFLKFETLNFKTKCIWTEQFLFSSRNLLGESGFSCTWSPWTSWPTCPRYNCIFFSYFCRKNNEKLRNMYNDNLLAAGADEIEWADVNQGLLKLF